MVGQYVKDFVCNRICAASACRIHLSSSTLALEDPVRMFSQVMSNTSYHWTPGTRILCLGKLRRAPIRPCRCWTCSCSTASWLEPYFHWIPYHHLFMGARDGLHMSLRAPISFGWIKSAVKNTEWLWITDRVPQTTYEWEFTAHANHAFRSWGFSTCCLCWLRFSSGGGEAMRLKPIGNA